MPRLYHSPSSILTARNGDEGCDFAWALRYLEGVRDPEVEWGDIESGRVQVLKLGARIVDPHTQCTPRQKSTSLGKAMHKVGEDYYEGRSPKWSTLPGKIFISGRHLLPMPMACGVIETEKSIGTIPTGATEDYAPKTCIEVEGIRLAGNRDLLTCFGPAERDRLILPSDFEVGEPLQVDYKSSSCIAKYAKTSEDLFNDLQCCVYTIDACADFSRKSIFSRWVYFETKTVRRALPVDTRIPLDHALEVVSKYLPTARRVDALKVLADAEKNPYNCDRYAGCPHHISAGGPCNARKSFGSTMSQGSRGKMALTEAQKAQFAKFQANKTAAPTAVVEDPAVAEAPTVVEAPAAVEAPVPAPKAPKTPKAPKAPKVAPPPEPGVEETETVEPVDVEAFEGEVDGCGAEERTSSAVDIPQPMVATDSKSRKARLIVKLAHELSEAQSRVDYLLSEIITVASS